MAAKKASTQQENKKYNPLMKDGKDWDRNAVMDHICDKLATTSLGIGSILKAGFNGHNLPNYSSIMGWISPTSNQFDQSLLEKYTRAKEAQADFMADEILDIADNSTNDWMEANGKDGENLGWKLNNEHVQRSRLRIESRKWLASKLKPKRYGEKLAVGGSDDMPAIKTITTEMTPQDAAKAYAEMVAIKK